MEEGKQLDFNAPLLSVRGFAAAPPPAPPLSSSSTKAATTANSRAEVGGGGAAVERPQRSSLPFYKSELKSGPVRNPGVVPFVWEQSPGRPKDGSFPGDSPGRPAQPPVMAPKPPPGRIPRRHPPDEKEEPLSTDASNPAINSASLRRSSPISSSTSMHANTTTITTTAATTTSPVTVNRTSLPKTSQSPREEPKGKMRTTPMVEPAAEAPISKEHRSVNDEEDEEEDAFSDALDTLSRTESFFMNCSVSGMTGGTEACEHSGRFSADPQFRYFMMGRFLPAAQAMATESSQCPARKTAVATPSREPPRRVLGNGGEFRRPAAPLPPQQRPSLVSTDPRGITHQLDVGDGEGSDSDDDGEDYDGAGRLPMKGCGLLPRFCLKSSFCVLNPVPGMKVRGCVPLPASRSRSPQLRTSHHGSVGDAEDEHSWEEVYKDKLRRERHAMGEEGSKLTSESNQLSYWSDFQTPDRSSPYRRSNGGVSPYRNDVPLSPFLEGKGFLGVPKCENRTGKGHAAFEQCAKDDGEYWEISPHVSSKEKSGSVSPVVEKTIYVDSVQVLENPDSKLCSSETEGMMKCVDKNSDIGRESQRIETSPILGICKNNALWYKISEAVDAEGLYSIDQSCALEQNNAVDSRHNHVLNSSQPLKDDDQRKNDDGSFQPLLPPPLPKSPSESWLWRTLPSISSKNPAPQSFLDFQFHRKKQANQATPTDPKWKAMVKTSVLNSGQARFADALVKPTNVD